MRDPLQRLYETKLAFLATVFVVLGIALLVAAHTLGRLPALHWVSALPVADVGSGLFTTGLIAVVFEYLDGKDSDTRATARLRRVLREQAPALRDAVIDGFAFKADDLARVSSPEVLDQLTRNSLALQLGDADFASDIYDDLKAQVLRAGERRYDLRVSIDLSQWDRGTRTARTPFYVATLRWEYSTVPVTPVRRFACVAPDAEYRELLQDPASTSAWRFHEEDGVTADLPEAFELVQFSVDGTERPVRRTAKAGGQVYSVSLGKDVVAAAEPVKIAYTYRTLVRRDGHLLRLTFGQPTKGVEVELRYGGTDISHVTVLDFIAGSRAAMVRAASPELPTGSVGVSFEGWAMPQSGAGFVW